MEIIIGTTNPGKVREIGSILAPLGFELKPQSLDVEEIGKTIAENAAIKGKAYSAANPGKLVLAEDSGIVVPKLNGLPGPYSARFHSVELDEFLNVVSVPPEEFTTDKTEHDRLNNERLTKLVAKLPESQRAAYFEVAFVVVRDGEILHESKGRADGFVTTEPKGTNGFGYDPVFVGSDTFGSTYAQLDSARKNARSHRKKALRELGFWLATQVRDGKLK